MVTGNQPVTIAEVYDILVTQSQDLTVYCNAAKPGTQPYALCGLTTCAGVEEYDYLGACKCAPETIDEMYDLGVPRCCGAFTSFKRLVSISR